jgi:hypothetical protein
VIVEAQVCDPITGLDSKLRQRGSEPFAALTELGVGKLLVPGHDADFGAEQIHGAVETADRS